MGLHIPVMAEEVIEQLNLEPGRLIVDGTAGCGGHALRILEKIVPGGMLVGIDEDDGALKIAEQQLASYKGFFKLIHNNFRNLDSILKSLDIDKIDGLLFDLGVSSIHFDTPSRGFSIRHNGPLDMRMDRRNALTARTIVNALSYEKLERILREYGDEKKSHQIAHFIVDKRKQKPIETTFELSKLIENVYKKPRYSWRIHPATKTFLALRIAVNDELNALKDGLISGIKHINSGCRIVIISFHSLEDRIVKNIFKEYKKRGELRIITKSPLRPCSSEVRKNPRARSAKLRAVERV